MYSTLGPNLEQMPRLSDAQVLVVLIKLCTATGKLVLITQTIVNLHIIINVLLMSYY